MGIIRSDLTGERSTTRSFMWFFTGWAMAVCMGIVVAIFLDQTNILHTGITWEPFEGVMDWLKALVFASVIPFLVNESINGFVRASAGKTSPMVEARDVEVNISEPPGS